MLATESEVFGTSLCKHGSIETVCMAVRKGMRKCYAPHPVTYISDMDMECSTATMNMRSGNELQKKGTLLCPDGIQVVMKKSIRDLVCGEQQWE